MKLQQLSFVIVDGTAHESGPGLGLFPDFAASGARGLFAVAEASRGETAACHEAVQGLAEGFGKGHSSLTAALGSSLLSVHQQRRALNARALASQQVQLGLTCAAVRENELYIGQAGPSLAFHWQGESLTRLSPRRPEVALGGLEFPEVEFQRRAVQAGDALLIASSSLDGLVAPDGLAVALAEGPDEAARRLYRAVRGQPHFVALFLTFHGEEARGSRQAPPPGASRSPRRSIWRRLAGAFLPAQPGGNENK